ncbi:MAG: YqgE/AlgH family protein [Bacteroidales bacterium]|nr:YqgE/AlgH family protein [Bacteroidales bacterium]
MKQKIDLFTIKPEDKIPAKGKLLISEPFLQDTFFNRSLVYLTEHTEKGSVGFILNKKVSIKLNEAIEGFGKWDNYLTMGGPVAPDTLHYLHTLGDKIPNSVWIGDNIYWGGDIEALKEYIAAGTLNHDEIRFFLGYSGWGEGQLEKELNENSWVIGNAPPSAVMTYRTEDTWKMVLRNMNKRYKIWADFPESPEMN